MKQLFTSITLVLLLLWGSSASVRAQVLDPTFQPTVLKKPYIGGLQSGVQVLAVQPDGKILAAGGFDFVNGTLASKIQRLNADGTTDAAFNPGGIGANGFISAVLVQPDGKILIAGGFTAYNNQPAYTVARLNANGTLDATFAQQPEEGRRQLSSLALQPDGKILVGSSNSFIAGNAGVLTRLNANGTPDPSFNIGAGVVSGLVYAIVVQADGKIVVGGSFTNFNGQAGGLARLNSDGSLDNAFVPGTGVTGTVFSLVQQPDGKFLAGGSFTQVNGQPAPGVARLLPDGTLDNTFAPGTGATITNTATPPAVFPAAVRTIRVQANGSILVGGTFTQFNGVARGRVARLLPTGALDPAFAAGTGANNTVFALAELATGQVVVGGSQTLFDTNPKTGLSRLSATGTDDATFAPVVEVRGTINRAVPLANGQILVLGDFTNLNGTAATGTNLQVRRLNANGSLDLTYAAPGVGSFLGVQPDGTFYALISTGNNQTLNALRRILPSGATDNSFATTNITTPANNAPIVEVVAQPNGSLLLIGNFLNVGGVARNGMARLNADGTLDNSFTPPTSAVSRRVLSAIVQASGKIVITYQEPATSFSAFNTLARLNADGTLDNSFAIGSGGGPNSVVTVLQQPDGKLLVSGATAFNGQAAPFGIVRLSADGANDATFNGLTNFYVLRTVQPNGRILATEGALNSAFGLVRLNSDGSLDNSFARVAIPSAFFTGEDLLFGIALQPADQKILVFGSFRSVAGQLRIGLARLTNPNVTSTRPAVAALPLEVYPNPTRQFLTVALPAVASQAALLDLTGRAVRTWALPVQQTEARLDLSTVAAGVYVLRIPGAAGVYQQKVVVTR